MSFDRIEQDERLLEETVAAKVEGITTPLQEHFLRRLEDLGQRRQEHLQDKEALHALDKVIYSTYMDCVSAGVGDQAHAVLERAQ